MTNEPCIIHFEDFLKEENEHKKTSLKSKIHLVDTKTEESMSIISTRDDKKAQSKGKNTKIKTVLNKTKRKKSSGILSSKVVQEVVISTDDECSTDTAFLNSPKKKNNTNQRRKKSNGNSNTNISKNNFKRKTVLNNGLSNVHICKNNNDNESKKASHTFFQVNSKKSSSSLKHKRVCPTAAKSHDNKRQRKASSDSDVIIVSPQIPKRPKVDVEKSTFPGKEKLHSTI